MASQSEWNKFFLDAKIPKDVAPLYAKSFYKNRMSFDMLADLTKDYLRDLDITALGDIISILKHPRTGVFKMTSTSEWNEFFLDAKIPKDFASLYAKNFYENRMSFDMLADLTKDYLRDLDITVLGDVISILKHAKDVQSKQDSEVLMVPVPKQIEKKMMSDLIACSNCMKSFTLESDISTTPCGHVFHTDCIEKTDCFQCRKACESGQIIKLCFTESQSAIEEQISINDSEQKSLEFDEKMLELEEKRRMCDELLSEKSTEIIQAKKKYKKLEKEKLEKKLGFHKTEKNLKKSIIEANKQIKALKNEVNRQEGLKIDLEKLEKENLQLRKNASSFEQSMSEEKLGFRKTEEDFEKSINEANKQIKALEKEVNSQKGLKKKLEEENLQLSKNASSFEELLSEETNRNKSLDKKLKDANRKIEDLKEVNLDSRLRDFPEFQQVLKIIVVQFMNLECLCETCRDQSTINYINSQLIKIAENVGQKIKKLESKCEACNPAYRIYGDPRLHLSSTKSHK